MTQSARAAGSKGSRTATNQLGAFTWREVKALSSDTPVIIPIASLEQHGPHLPLCTDSILTGEIVRRAVDLLGGRGLFAPVLWLGSSEHHLDFAGTLSASPRTYISLVSELVQNFLHHGFRRIVLLNGHGGNEVPAKQAMFELRQQHRRRSDLLLLAASYWSQADLLRLKSLGLRQGHIGHACEWETSMMLQLAPDLVGAYRRLPPIEPAGAFGAGQRAWVTQDRSKLGYIGYPHLASAQKGEGLLQVFTDGVVGLIERMTAWDGREW